MSRPRFAGLLLALITLLVYLPVRRHEFVAYDDGDYLTENRIVQNGLTSAGVKWAFTSWHASNWHPLTWLSHMLDCELFGLDAGAHHLVNVLFHTANSVLLLALLFRLTGKLGPAAMVAALFAWHPLHVESVAWASERKDVLSAFFALLTLLVYTRYAQETKTRNPQSKYFYFAALFLYALGLLAKPMLVTLPFVLLLLDYWPLNRVSGARGQLSGEKPRAEIPDTSHPSPLLKEKWPFFLLAAASCVVTFLAQRAAAVLSIEQYPLNLRLGNAVLSSAHYLLKTFWPVNLAIPYPPLKFLPLASTFVAGIVIALISGLVWRARRTSPYLWIGWLWFLGMLVPVIGLVQAGHQSMADRYTYLPHIGLFIAVVYGIHGLAVRWRVPIGGLMAGAGLILAICVLRTEQQLGFWQNNETLFTHALAVTQDNAIAHINVGVALQQKGRREEALAHYREALRIDPAFVESHNNLAILLDEMDRNDEALAQYQEALRLAPDAPLAHCNFGALLAKLNRFDEARSQYLEAARLIPENALPHYLMGKLALRQGDSSAAVVHFRDALRQDPDDVRTLIYLARLLASAGNPQLRNGAEAVALAERANALTGTNDPFVLDTLAMAYAETGQFDRAQQTIQQALDRAVVSEGTPPPPLQQRQQLYKSRQPFHESSTNAPAELPAARSRRHI